MQSGKNDNYDIVINIQGDEPLVNSNQLDQLIDAFKDEKIQIATLGIETSDLKVKIATEPKSFVM